MAEDETMEKLADPSACGHCYVGSQRGESCSGNQDTKYDRSTHSYFQFLAEFLQHG